MWRPGVGTGRSQHSSGQSSQKTPRLQRAEPPGGHDDSIWTAAPWLSNLERRPIQRPPVSSRSISISSTHLMLSMCVRQWIQTQCGSPVGAGQGGISTRWQGYESSLHVRCKGTLHYVSGGRRVLDCVFFGRLLQQGANGGCWKALENRISPGKVGLRRAGIGRIDPDTTVRGINTEDTCRLRRIEHRPSPCSLRSPPTSRTPKGESHRRGARGNRSSGMWAEDKTNGSVSPLLSFRVRDVRAA